MLALGALPILMIALGLSYAFTGNTEDANSTETLTDDADTLRLEDEGVENLLALDGDDTIEVATERTTEIHLGAGNDVLTVNSGKSSAFGGIGDDLVTNASPNEMRAFLNDGNDTVLGTATGGSLFARGGEGDDLLEGSDAGDFLAGDSGQDVLNGNAGSDTLDGGLDNDTLNGGTQDDVLNGNGGDDVVRGGNGNDSVDGGVGHDVLNGGDGNDTVSGESGDDTMLGSDGRDLMFGGAGNDEMFGGNDEDTLNGGTGTDTLDGLLGDDVLRGGDGADILNGGANNDRLEGDDGDDFLDGGTGDDLLNGGEGDDSLSGHEGSDTLIISRGIDWIFGGDGDDFYALDAAFEHGSTLQDVGTTDEVAGDRLDATQVDHAMTLTFDAEQATLSGGGQAGQTLLNGIFGATFGDGDDTIDASNANEPVFVDAGSGDNDVIGSDGDDVLLGSGDLSGGAGEDELTATLDGAAVTTLAGGGDTDSFLADIFFDQDGDTQAGVARITDFEAGESVVINLEYLATNADGSTNAAPIVTVQNDATEVRVLVDGQVAVVVEGVSSLPAGTVSVVDNGYAADPAPVI